MFGPSLKSVFRNRWMALIWSGFVIWMAVDIAGTSSPDAGSGNNQSAEAENLTDVTGSPVTKEDIATLRRYVEGH
jgi:hypothetical protein